MFVSTNFVPFYLNFMKGAVSMIQVFPYYKKQNNLHKTLDKKISYQGLFQQFWEKAPGQNWEKKINLTSKLGEINDIEHYKGSKIYTQNQAILDCIMPSIPLKH